MCINGAKRYCRSHPLCCTFVNFMSCLDRHCACLQQSLCQFLDQHCQFLDEQWRFLVFVISFFFIGQFCFQGIFGSTVFLMKDKSLSLFKNFYVNGDFDSFYQVNSHIVYIDKALDIYIFSLGFLCPKIHYVSIYAMHTHHEILFHKNQYCLQTMVPTIAKCGHLRECIKSRF